MSAQIPTPAATATDLPSPRATTTSIATRRNRAIAPLTALPHLPNRSPDTLDPEHPANPLTSLADRDHNHELHRETWAHTIYHGMIAGYIPILLRLPSYANTPRQRDALGYIAVANYLHVRLPIGFEAITTIDHDTQRVTHYAGPWNVRRLREDAYRHADERLAEGADEDNVAKALEVYLLTGVARDEEEARFLVNDPDELRHCAYQDRWLWALGARGRAEDFVVDGGGGGEVALGLLGELPFEGRAEWEMGVLEAFAEMPLGGYDVETLVALPALLYDGAGEAEAAAGLARGRDVPPVDDIGGGGSYEESCCPICFCAFRFDLGDQAAFVLLCGHAFCVSCAGCWLKRDPRCPTCRRMLYRRMPLLKMPGFSMVTMDGVKLEDYSWHLEKHEAAYWDYYHPFGDIDQDEGEELAWLLEDSD